LFAAVPPSFSRDLLVIVLMARVAVKVGMGVHDAAVGMAMGMNQVCPQKEIGVG
jgi:hypothetical protein